MSDGQVQVPSRPSHLTPTCMESVNRVAKLPVVESTFQTATNIYEKVKDYNSLTQWTCSTAESAVHKAVEVGMPIAIPVVKGLERPIKTVDDALCSGLDYVESKVPAVKLPPSEIVYQIYTNTKEYVDNTVTPAVENAYSYIDPVVRVTYSNIEPFLEQAKTMMEPTMHLVEPLVQPALDKAQALKEYGTHKLEEFMQCSHHPNTTQALTPGTTPKTTQTPTPSTTQSPPSRTTQTPTSLATQIPTEGSSTTEWECSECQTNASPLGREAKSSKND